MRITRFMVAAAAGMLVVAAPATAQSYPSKTIRLVIPFATGGNTDIIGRIFVPKMAEILGQQIIIDNRGGAGGTIGTEFAVRQAPDGYTLLMASAGHTINPAMIRKLPYDSIKDFAPIGIVADVPTAFVIHPSLPPKNLQEFITLARSRPNDIFYSTAGRGTVGHLSAELLISMAKVKLTAVHYKGSGPSMVQLVGGHVQMQFPSMPAAVPHVANGKLRMIAQTGARRSSAAPTVPTMQEQGLKGFVVSSGFSMFAPAGTPKPVIDKLSGALSQALKDPRISKTLIDRGAEPVGSTPAEHDKFNREAISRWIKVARDAGIEPN